MISHSILHHIEKVYQKFHQNLQGSNGHIFLWPSQCSQLPEPNKPSSLKAVENVTHLLYALKQINIILHSH